MVRRRTLSTADAAKLLDVSVQSVANWINQGLLKADRTPGGHRRIQLEHLMQFLKDQDMRIPEELSRGGDAILVVDDEPAVAQYIAREMGERYPKVDILIANDGYAAGELAALHRPRIILLDLMMPGMDGFGVCQRIKANPLTRDACVIAVTAHCNAEVEKRILDMGAVACLAKPVDIGLLTELIHQAISEP